MEAKWQSCLNPWGVPSTLPPQTPMQETKNKLINYIQTLERPPETPEEFELLQYLLSERERNPEEVEQRGRVRRMFRSWLYRPAPELAYALSAQLTPRNIVDLYSDISNMAVPLIAPDLEVFGDLLGCRLDSFNQMLFDRHMQFGRIGLQFAEQLNVSVPSLLLQQTSKYKKIAISDAKGLAAIRELWAQDIQDLEEVPDGQLGWLMFQIFSEADYLTRLLLDSTPVEKRRGIDSHLSSLKCFEGFVLGTGQFITPSEQQQETSQGFGYITASIEGHAAKLASENPDYDRVFFSPWIKACQIALGQIRNSGYWRTQWIDKLGERQKSKKGQKVNPRDPKAKGFGSS
jgi:hypothetical protein